MWFSRFGSAKTGFQRFTKKYLWIIKRQAWFPPYRPKVRLPGTDAKKYSEPRRWLPFRSQYARLYGGAMKFTSITTHSFNQPSGNQINHCWRIFCCTLVYTGSLTHTRFRFTYCESSSQWLWFHVAGHLEYLGPGPSTTPHRQPYKGSYRSVEPVQTKCGNPE